MSLALAYFPEASLVRFGVGALAYLLKNRFYIGEVVRSECCFPDIQSAASSSRPSRLQ
jgi:hypothetical protein